MLNTTFKTTRLALAVLSAFAAAPIVADEGKQWSHQVGVTAFAFALEGDAGVKGITAEMDYGIGDVFDNLQGALTMLVQGNNQQFGYWMSYEFVELGDDIKKTLLPDNEFIGATIKAEADFGTEIIDAGLSYFISDTVELIGGVRAWNVEQDFNISISRELTGMTNQISESVDESWIDAFVGVRARIPLGGCWSLNLRGDLGAGDSDSTYQALAMVAFEHDNNWTTSAGVRYLAVDYAKDGFTFDMEMTGFEVAALYRF